jgi:type II secretory pathway component PulF
MARFAVRYLTESGKVVSRSIEAADEAACEAMIAAASGVVIGLRRAGGGGTGGGPERSRPYPFACISEFTSLLSQLLSAALNVKDALDVLHTVAGRPDVRNLAASLAEDIGKGLSFRDAMRARVRGLPPVYLGLISVGDRTGDLPRAYKRLDSYLADRKKIRDRVAGALAYPIIVLAVAFLGVLALSLFAVPKLQEIFAQLGGTAAEQLSASLDSARVAFGAFGAAGAGLAIGAVGLYWARKADASAAIRIDRTLISLPVVGGILEANGLLDFCFAMEVMTAGGITLDDALDEAVATVGNAAYKAAIANARTAVRGGASLSQAVGRESAFPAFVKQWLAVGERTGQTSLVFGRMREFYQALAEKRANVMLSVLEPAISILLGIVMLAVVAFFILPIFTAYGSLL